MTVVPVQPEEGDKNSSKFWIYVCKLEGEGGEDAAVLEIARTEERCSQ